MVVLAVAEVNRGQGLTAVQVSLVKDLLAVQVQEMEQHLQEWEVAAVQALQGFLALQVLLRLVALGLHLQLQDRRFFTQVVVEERLTQVH
jgi:hypothetical protein